MQNVWHHAAITFEKTADNTGTVRLYLNGAQVGSPTTVTWALRQDLALVIGGITSTSSAVASRYFNGWLDDTVLFRGAMSAPEIANLATQSVATFSGFSVAATVPLSVLTQQQNWRQQYFGTTANTGTAANLFDANSDGLTFTVEWSDTLAANSWSNAGVTEQILNDNGIVQSVKATLSAGSSSKRFVHLKITKP